MTLVNVKSYTQTYQKHEVCGFGCKVVCNYDKQYSKPAEIYRVGQAPKPTKMM